MRTYLTVSSCSSLEVCQHEDDIGAGDHANLGPVRFESMLSSAGGHASPYLASPVLEHIQQSAGQSGTLNPALFALIDSVESVHSFTMRCLRDILGSRQGVENVVAYYFNSTNIWFTIIEKDVFQSRVEDMWSNPSAETGIVILSMFLATRTPQANHPSAMTDGLYISTKTLFSLIQSKLPLSVSLMQAQLLIAMYEFAHSMPQQAYMSIGQCYQMSKAFGWHNKLFWTEERQRMAARDLKLCSILWWAIVFVDWCVNPEREAFLSHLPPNTKADAEAVLFSSGILTKSSPCTHPRWIFRYPSPKHSTNPSVVPYRPAPKGSSTGIWIESRR